MRQRGRKSVAANVVALDVTGGPARLTAPPGLTTAERAVFNDLIATCDPRHFVQSDLPLLVSFVQVTVLARSAAGKPSGSRLTFESRRGFPSDLMHAILAHANWNFHHSQAR